MENPLNMSKELDYNWNESKIIDDVDYAEDDALKPWRFYLKENKWVSRF